MQQRVGRADDERGAAAAVGQGERYHVGPVGEGVEEARVGGGKGTGDGLVGVADAHPVAVWSGQAANEGFLQGHAVLGLVFQHVGPAAAQRLGQIGFVLQPVGGRPDEVVIVQSPLPGQRRLIAAVDAGQHVHERRAGYVGGAALAPTLCRRARGFSVLSPAPLLPCSPAPRLPRPYRRENLLRPIAFILRFPNEGGGRCGRDVAPTGDHLGAVLAAVVRQERFPQAGVVVDPAIDGGVEKLAALAFVKHRQLFAQDVAADADDLQGQAVEGAHVEAGIGQAHLQQAATDTSAEGVDAGVEEGDDEHLLAVGCVDAAVGDELRGQQRQGERLAAAGHGADRHTTGAVGQNRFLGWAQAQGWGRGCVYGCVHWFRSSKGL
jgi:hypothetical protein